MEGYFWRLLRPGWWVMLFGSLVMIGWVSWRVPELLVMMIGAALLRKARWELWDRFKVVDLTGRN